MINDLRHFKNFIHDYLSILEALTEKDQKIENETYYTFLAKLRLTEHSFNFLLDQFMYLGIKSGAFGDVITSDEFHEIKRRRNIVARKISQKISADKKKQNAMLALLQDYMSREQEAQPNLKKLFVEALREAKEQNY